MKAVDFITQTRVELDEKGSKFWSDEELFIKLQRSYIALQKDLPFFMHKEVLNIKKGEDSSHLMYEPLKNVRLVIEDKDVAFVDYDNIYLQRQTRAYTFYNKELLLNFTLEQDIPAAIVYKHAKNLDNINCYIEIPSIHYEALRLLLFSKIHEKPTRNTKDRNLSTHYLKLYERELREVSINKKTRPTGLGSKYQII